MRPKKLWKHRPAGSKVPLRRSRTRRVAGIAVVAIAALGSLTAGMLAMTGIVASSDPDGPSAQTAPNGATNDEEPSSEADDGSRPASRPQDPPGLQGEHIPAEAGHATRAGDLLVKLVDAGLQDDVAAVELLVVNVEIINDTTARQPYNLLAFSLYTEAGREMPPRPNPRDDALGVGHLQPGAAISGSIVFHAGQGAHRLLYDPHDATGDAPRLVWEIGV